MAQTSVTVLMPVYNGESYVGAAIESILKQTFKDFEFLIIDDGSSDGSARVIKAYRDPRIRLIRNEVNRGLVACLNDGIELACGEFIARMDCDDISLPRRLKKQIEYMYANPNVAVCGAWIKGFGETRAYVLRYPAEAALVRTSALFFNPIAHSTTVLRKRMFERLRYSNEYPGAEDWDLWRRVAEQAEVANIPDVLLKYRIHSASVSRGNRELHQTARFRLIDEQLRNLGLKATEEEIKLHEGIYNDVKPFSLNRLDELGRWLERLHNANQLRDAFPVTAMSCATSNAWLRGCRQAWRCGIKAWRRYHNVPAGASRCVWRQDVAVFAALCGVGEVARVSAAFASSEEA